MEVRIGSLFHCLFLFKFNSPICSNNSGGEWASGGGSTVDGVGEQWWRQQGRGAAMNWADGGNRCSGYQFGGASGSGWAGVGNNGGEQW